MKLLILAAGYGTRLKALGEGTPKALLLIDEKPILSYIVDLTRDLKGLTGIIVVTNDKFYKHFVGWKEGQQDMGVPIDIVNDGTKTPDDRLGSIGDIHYVLKKRNIDQDVLVVGGDNLFDYNLQEYMNFAAAKPQAVTIGLYDILNLDDARKFGVVTLDGSKKIISFDEKPHNPASSLVAMCFYFLPKETLPLVGEYLNDIDKSDTAGDYIRWLCRKNDVYGFQFKGSWYDIGSIESYKEAQKKFKA